MARQDRHQRLTAFLGALDENDVHLMVGVISELILGSMAIGKRPDQAVAVRVREFKKGTNNQETPLRT